MAAFAAGVQFGAGGVEDAFLRVPKAGEVRAMTSPLRRARRGLQGGSHLGAFALAPESGVNPYWRRNLYVCLFGSFVNMAGMTILLPFLPNYVRDLGVHDAEERRVLVGGGVQRLVSRRRDWCRRSGAVSPTSTAASRC